MNQIMKIGKGVEEVDGVMQAVPAYIGKCSTSLSRLLDNGDVTVKAMGNRAIANTMKIIERVARMKKAVGKTVEIDVPVFVLEKVGENELAIFNITVSCK